MGYISLPSNLISIIGIKSYYCVNLKMVILHDAIKTMENGIFAFFIKKEKKLYFQKTKKFGFKKTKKQVGCFFKKTVLSILIVFQFFL